MEHVKTARIKTVLHVHTDRSNDSNASPADIVRDARASGIDCVAITDHDDIRAARELARGGEIRVIVGEEISTRQGHLLGLFLSERVPPGLSARETAERVRSQGGVVLVPHPFSPLCCGIGRRRLEELSDVIDAVEVHNAQNVFAWEDWRADRYCRSRSLTRYVGGDVHLRGHLGTAYQRMDDFATPADFLRSLVGAELVRRRHGIGYVVRMLWQEFARRTIRCPAPGFGARWRPTGASDDDDHGDESCSRKHDRQVGAGERGARGTDDARHSARIPAGTHGGRA